MSANATGTPTTNFSIPKFNTASDAPNGKGVNEMMDAIDTLFGQRAPKITTSTFAGGPPSTPTTGDIWIATAVPSSNAVGPRWTFQWDSSDSIWHCVGGSPTWLLGYSNANPASTGNVWTSVGSLTMARAGRYNIVSAGFQFTSTLTASVLFGVGVAGAISSGLGSQTTVAGSSYSLGGTSTLVDVTAGQTINIMAFDNTALTAANNSLMIMPLYIT